MVVHFASERERADAILAAHYAGKRSLTMRKELHVSAKTIAKVLAANGIVSDRSNIGRWTAELASRLEALWATDLSAAEIGKELGFSKRCILNKARRLDLPFKKPPLRRLTKRKASNGVTSLPRPLYDAPALPSLSLSLMALETFQCRWITEGEGASALFCGHVSAKPYGYCEAHHAIAYAPAEARPRNQRHDYHLFRSAA
jgi:hypothetical protein